MARALHGAHGLHMNYKWIINLDHILLLLNQSKECEEPMNEDI